MKYMEKMGKNNNDLSIKNFFEHLYNVCMNPTEQTEKEKNIYVSDHQRL